MNYFGERQLRPRLGEVLLGLREPRLGGVGALLFLGPGVLDLVDTGSFCVQDIDRVARGAVEIVGPEVIILDDTRRDEDQQEAEDDHDDAARGTSENAANARDGRRTLIADPKIMGGSLV